MKQAVPDSRAIDVRSPDEEKYASREWRHGGADRATSDGGVTIRHDRRAGQRKKREHSSLLLSSRAVSLVRRAFGVVTRATHDFLFKARRVSATLDLLSIDLKTRTARSSRANARSPMILRMGRCVSSPLVGPIRSLPMTSLLNRRSTCG